MKTLNERILKNLITTLVGLVIIIVTVILYYKGTIGAEALPGLIGWALTLVWAKDTLIGAKPQEPAQ